MKIQVSYFYEEHDMLICTYLAVCFALKKKQNIFSRHMFWLYAYDLSLKRVRSRLLHLNNKLKWVYSLQIIYLWIFPPIVFLICITMDDLSDFII